jgi:hypothetical protein
MIDFAPPAAAIGLPIPPATPSESALSEAALTAAVGRFRFDPLGYVMFAFPWQRPGTVLEHESGPEPWQRDILERLGKGLMASDEAVRVAVASGHGILPDDRDLLADLTNVDYGYDASDAIRLERKDDMRRRGLASPDDGDALALTFAYPVAKRDWAEERRFEEGLARLRRSIV